MLLSRSAPRLSETPRVARAPDSLVRVRGAREIGPACLPAEAGWPAEAPGLRLASIPPSAAPDPPQHQTWSPRAAAGRPAPGGAGRSPGLRQRRLVQRRRTACRGTTAQRHNGTTAHRRWPASRGRHAWRVPESSPNNNILYETVVRVPRTHMHHHHIVTHMLVHTYASLHTQDDDLGSRKASSFIMLSPPS